MNNRIRKAIFPVAGLGTRFLPVTKVVPKELLPIIDKPLIHYAFNEAVKAGIETFIFITGRGKSNIVDYFDHSPELESHLNSKGNGDIIESLIEDLPKAGQVVSIRQQKPLGLGHAVLCAKDMIGDDPFAVILPDELLISDPPCLKIMIDRYNNTGGHLIAAMEVPKEETCNYGILDVKSIKNDGLIHVNSMVEKPDSNVAPSCFANIGRYILDSSIFNSLKNQKPGSGGEIQLTDAINDSALKTQFHAQIFDGERFDCGSKIGYLEANLVLALKRPDLSHKMRAIISNLLK